MKERDIIFIPGKAFWCAATGIDIRKESHAISTYMLRRAREQTVIFREL